MIWKKRKNKPTFKIIRFSKYKEIKKKRKKKEKEERNGRRKNRRKNGGKKINRSTCLEIFNAFYFVKSRGLRFAVVCASDMRDEGEPAAVDLV